MQSEILSCEEERKFYIQIVCIILKILALFNIFRTQNLEEVFKRSLLRGTMDRKQTLMKS